MKTSTDNNGMKTGGETKVTVNSNVNGQYKKSIIVDGCQLMTQSSSKGRGGRMDLKGGNALPQDESAY